MAVPTGARDVSKFVKLVSLVHAYAANPNDARFRTFCVLAQKPFHFFKNVKPSYSSRTQRKRCSLNVIHVEVGKIKRQFPLFV